MMLDFICDVLGYQLQSTTHNYDQYIVYTGCMLIFVMMVLVVYLLVRFLQWIWRGVK